jgi:hypothetical protein
MPIRKKLRRRSLRSARKPQRRPSLTPQEKQRIEELKGMLEDIHEEVNQIQKIRFGNSSFGTHPLDHFGVGTAAGYPSRRYIAELVRIYTDPTIVDKNAAVAALQYVNEAENKGTAYTGPNASVSRNMQGWAELFKNTRFTTEEYGAISKVIGTIGEDGKLTGTPGSGGILSNAVAQNLFVGDGAPTLDMIMGGHIGVARAASAGTIVAVAFANNNANPLDERQNAAAAARAAAQRARAAADSIAAVDASKADANNAAVDAETAVGNLAADVGDAGGAGGAGETIAQARARAEAARAAAAALANGIIPFLQTITGAQAAYAGMDGTHATYGAVAGIVNDAARDPDVLRTALTDAITAVTAARDATNTAAGQPGVNAANDAPTTAAADAAVAALAQAQAARQAIDAAAADVEAAVTPTQINLVADVAALTPANPFVTLRGQLASATGAVKGIRTFNITTNPDIGRRDNVPTVDVTGQFEINDFDVAGAQNGANITFTATEAVAPAAGGVAPAAIVGATGAVAIPFNYGYEAFEVHDVDDNVPVAAAGGARALTTGVELGQPVYFRIQLRDGVPDDVNAGVVAAVGAFRLEVVGAAAGGPAGQFFVSDRTTAVHALAGPLPGAGAEQGNADLIVDQGSYEFYFVPTDDAGAGNVRIQVTDLLHPLAGAAHVQTFDVPIVAPYTDLPVSAAGIVRHDIVVATGEPAAGAGADETGHTINTSFTGPLHANGNLGVIDVAVQLKDAGNNDLARAVKFNIVPNPIPAGVEVRAGTSGAVGGALPAIGAGGAINDFTTTAAGAYAFHIVYTGDANMVRNDIHLVEDRTGPLQEALNIAAYNRAQTAAAVAAAALAAGGAGGGAGGVAPPVYTADHNVAAGAGAIRPAALDIPLNFGLEPNYGFTDFAVTEAGAAAPAPFAHTAVITPAAPGAAPTKSFTLHLDPAAIAMDKLAFNVEYDPALGTLLVTGTTGAAANAVIGGAAAPAAGAGGPLRLYPLTLNANTTNVTFRFTPAAGALPQNADIRFIPLVPTVAGALTVNVTFQNYKNVANATNDLVFRTTNALQPSERVQKEAEEAWKNVTTIAPIDAKYSVLREPKNWLPHLRSPETRRSLYATLGDFIKYLSAKQAELVQAHPGTFKPTAGVAAGTPYSADDFKQLELFLSYSIVRELVKGSGVIHKIKLRFGSAPPAPAFTDVSYFQPDTNVFDAWRGYVYLKVITALTISCVLFTYAFHASVASPATKQFIKNAASHGLIVEHEVSFGRERVKLLTCMTAECAEQFERMESRAPHWTQVALRRLNAAGELEVEIHKFVTPTFLYAFMDFFSSFGGREFSA